MSKNETHDIVVGLDIGTSKVAAIVGAFDESGQLHIKGFGSHPSRGLKRGIVVNIDATVQSIQAAVEEAETMAGLQIDSTFTGIAGSHIRSLNSHGVVAIHQDEVTAIDIDRVIDVAKAVAIPADQKILHILPQDFTIDNQAGIREPIGMAGVRLEAKVHMVTGAMSAAQNIIKCVRRCGLQVDDIILEQLASSYAVLTEDEKELGVCLIDIGAGTTDIAIFTDGVISHTAVIPVAGDQATSDLAIALQVPTQYAESLKLKHACALSHRADSQENIIVSSLGGRAGKKYSQKFIANVLEPRYEELFSLIRDEIYQHGFESALGAGIVLTGGGSKVPYLDELAESVFSLPVRLGSTHHRVQGLDNIVDDPCYATSIGLLLYGQQQQLEEQFLGSKRRHSGGAWSKVKSWFQGNF